MATEPRVILVVDDDDSVREALDAVLARPGRRIHAACDGEEALEVVERGVKPCLVLLDWVMPRVDGAAFLASRERSPALRDVPVFVTSATHVSTDDARVQAVLPKPIELDRLLSAVAATCEDHCARRADCPFHPTRE